MAIIQKLSNGSHGVTIPKDTMRIMGLKQGDDIVPINHDPKNNEMTFKLMEKKGE